jgi:hypothetical protein
MVDGYFNWHNGVFGLNLVSLSGLDPCLMTLGKKCRRH